MKIVHLILENWEGYAGVHTVDFKDKPSPYFIRGEYTGDPDSSNLAGKSSFVNAIRYAWYGTTHRRTLDKLINDQADRMVVTMVVALDDGSPLTIIRSRTRKGDNTFEVSGCEAGDRQEYLNKILGCGEEDFLLTRFFAQGDLLAFLSLKSGEKKSRFRTWLGLGHWERALETAKSDLASHDKKISEVKGRMSFRQQEIDKAPDVDAAALAKRNSEMTQEMTDLKKKREDVIVAEVKAEAQIKAAREATTSRTNAEQLVERERQALHTAESIASQRAPFQEKIEKLEPIRNNVTVAREQRNQTAQVLTAEEATYEQRKSIKDKLANTCGKCPIDEGECPRDMTPAVSQLEGELGKRDQYLAHVRDVLSQHNSHVGGLEDQEKDLNSAQATLQRLPVSDAPDAVRVRLTAAETALAALPSTPAAAPESNGFAEQKQTLAEEDRKLSEEWDTIRDQLKLLEDLEGLKEQQGADQDTLDQLTEQRGRLQFLVYMFGPNGIPSYQTENAFGEIEEETNSRLARTGMPFRLQLRAFREIQKKESHCPVCGEKYTPKVRSCKACGHGPRRNQRKDEVVMVLQEAGRRESEADDSSGGGKTLIAFAVRLGIARFLLKRRAGEGNILVLDEIFGALDASRRRALLSVITEDQQLFPQIFVISHTDLTENPPGSVLVVTKDGANSSVGWE